MAQSDNLKRYLDAGVAFTQMTRDRAEAIVQDLVEAGEIRRKEAQKWIEELLERSQKNTEDLLAMVRREVADQLKNMGLDDLAKRAGTSAAAKPVATKAAAATTTSAKKAPAKKTGVKQTAAKKSGGAKKTGAAKATKKA